MSFLFLSAERANNFKKPYGKQNFYVQNFVISTVSNLLILPCNEHQPSIDNTTPKPTSSTHFSLKSLTCDGVYLQESCSFLKRVYSHIKEVAAERCFMKSNVLPKNKQTKKKCSVILLFCYQNP